MDGSVAAQRLSAVDGAISTTEIISIVVLAMAVGRWMAEPVAPAFDLRIV
jgi:hypothetical protein